MQMGLMPVAILMQRRVLQHRWASDAWSVAAVIANSIGIARSQLVQDTPDGQLFLMPGIDLSLYPDENDGYFENWIAPQPKVFVSWHMQGQQAIPVAASVSYGEGTRMLDSGDPADGVDMAADIHAWLGAYLQQHYRPAPARKAWRDRIKS